VNALRRALRRAGARALGLVLRLSARRAGVVLVYHALAERSGDPESELVPPHSVSLVEGQLGHVLSSYRVIAAADLPAAVAARRRGSRFPVAITFDDDLASHAELAAPLLRRLGVPATFFLTGASLERSAPFWWQQLQRAADRGLELPFPDERIHELAGRFERMTAAERTAVVASFEGEVDEAGLRAADVRQLVASGFDVGFHTLRHERLTNLDDEALAEALVEGRADLEAAAGRPLETIAYPHGKADARVAKAASAAGFRLGFTGRYEPVQTSTNPLLLGRIEPSFGDVRDFAAHLVGVLRRRPHR